MNSQNSEQELWQLYPYSFYTLSSEITNTIFLNESMKWLRDNGFSLDKWIDQGMDFKRLGDRYYNSGGYIMKRNRSNQLHEVIRTIIEYRIPLVFHNGMLDILHIYDKFIAQIPEKPTQISKEISKIFVGGIFDTKLVGKYLFDNLNCTLLKNTCLPVLYTTLTSMCDMKNLVSLAKERSHLNYFDKDTGNINDKLFHDAGFDSLVTAIVFCLELEILARSENLRAENLVELGNKKDLGNHIPKLINCYHVHDPIDEAIYNFTEHSKRN
ncbi:CAF1 family ribonuclease family protein [Theileria parva strain Muguga]|uniref:CAF1 family ribonuclease family protein n=1 Tax=Theileria parva strain Muguga TaxID=333668 RepID=UPI001C6247E8|nr:CAF1 family ribonuclease family protein [Theileria parva strain Muguga]EAN31613.2 CAF1 family ribonuclease family protein [Theileria parva strain Muguga]